jgi:hypothetical protein
MSQNESSTSATTTEEMSELIQETIFPSSIAAVADSSVFYLEPVMPRFEPLYACDPYLLGFVSLK